MSAEPSAEVDIPVLVERWRRDGCLVLRKVFDLDRVSRLREVCDHARDVWHAEATSESEPGGFGPNPDEWVLLHLNHPRYHRQSNASLPLLLDAIADPLILDLIGAIMEGDQVFEQANYYVDPASKSRIGKWHRDCQFYGGDDEVVRQRVLAEAEPPRELHVHIPLAPTAHTEVVPGSHRRWDTDEEYRIRTEDLRSEDIPGSQMVVLEPSDIALFHVNSIHRGCYPLGVLRRTIAVTYGSRRNPRLADRELMREQQGYVCTYQPWFKSPVYLEGVQPRTRAFFDQFIKCYADCWKPEYIATDWHPKRIAYFTPPFEATVR